MKRLLFLCVSLGILIFSVIVINIAPAINKLTVYDRNGNYVLNWNEWSNAACKRLSDSYDYESDKAQKDWIKKLKKRCNRRQAMIGLEYVISNLNIIFGFICAFSGFLLYKEIGRIGEDAKYIGLIGLGCGVIGIVLTLVYTIESGLVFNDIADGNGIKIESDGAFMKLVGDKYKCINYKKDNEDLFYLKYSDFGNKYLSYSKKIIFSIQEKEYKYYDCNIYGYIRKADLERLCEDLENNPNNIPAEYDFIKQPLKYYDTTTSPHTEKGTCDKLFNIPFTTDNQYKILYDRWLTTIIFCCFIILLNMGLAIFGLLLFLNPGTSSGSTQVKQFSN